ncbi:hypothetical protein RhiirA5_506341 [Rhizophagus irregularis]|uniref:Uncharacterized protein n=1 Tax=Rhizophagus irregularis TaxID=588596 RepID=A0A2N0NU45_9GLOM|nr:hypothetical protein RhiirA5_506341 [Rhizophagus irregularis]
MTLGHSLVVGKKSCTFSAFSFLVVLVSSCSPEIKDGNFISISLSTSPTYRFNILGFNLYPNNSSPAIGTWNSGSQPSDNEIFVLKQSIIRVYEFRPFISFYQNMIVEIPAASINNIGDHFIVSMSNNSENERFTIKCDACNLNANGPEYWIKYHSSCLIKNLASGFCADGKDLQDNFVTQVDCLNASKWDLYGISPDMPKTSLPTIISSGSPTTISELGLIVIIAGSIIGTAFISFIIGYCIIKCKLSSRNVQSLQSLKIPHAINN